MQWVVERCSIPIGLGFAALVTALCAGAMGGNANAQGWAIWATIAAWLCGIWFGWAGGRKDAPKA